VRLNILVVDDDVAYVQALRRVLQQLEPDWHVEHMPSHGQPLARALGASYDLICLEWSPQLTALGTLRELRALGSQAVILILSFYGDPDNRVAAINAGADDYVVKYGGADEIHARIKVALARRSSGRVLQCGPLRLEESSRRLTLKDKVIDLERHQWLLLFRLMQDAGKIVEASELSSFAAIPAGVGNKNLHNEMLRLRARIAERELIQFVRGKGYRILA
jgi:DNA-binding response OmpR family regulator